MSDPQSPQWSPYPLTLEPGKYWWCACGRSNTQPFCDGSHQGSEFSPVPFAVGPCDGVVWLCGCKYSQRKPFCDGRHNKLAKKKGA